jgi:predicted short-subunit dehydrogenase-like oxidoreductase (DUF2520 family)
MSDVIERQKPTVSIVGTGRLGTTLAVALKDRGYPIRYLVARHRKTVQHTANLLDAATEVLVAEQLPKLIPTDLILIATPDDQIDQVAEALAIASPTIKSKTVVLHTSGALSSAVLSPLLKRGWSTGSVHPLIAVSDLQTALDSLAGAFWCVEGKKGAVKVAQQMVSDLGGHSFSIAAADKPLYHAAAVMSSGNVVALFAVALGMLGECGINPKQAKRILLPLLRSAVRNLELKGPAEALTGTFSRGDIATVERHLDALSGSRLANARALYQMLGERSLKLATQKGLDRKLAKRIKQTLKQ